MVRVPRVGARRDTAGAGREKEAGEHFCPGCGVRQRFVPRYPRYFCRDCLALAEDCDGRRLAFFSAGPLGGFGWRYADDTTLGDDGCSAVVCLVRKCAVIVCEARFGGVVAEPLADAAPGLPQRRGIVRLTDATGAAEARRRLKPLPA